MTHGLLKITQATANIRPGKYSHIRQGPEVGAHSAALQTLGFFKDALQGAAAENQYQEKYYISSDNPVDYHLLVFTIDRKSYLFNNNFTPNDDDFPTGYVNDDGRTSIMLQGLTTATSIAEQVKLAIEHKDGHNGKLIVDHIGAAIIVKQLTAEKEEYILPNRDYLTGSIKNRTRFKARFSAPGGYEVMSRGFLDPAHEIYSVYNAMPWRNNWGRKVHSSQLQAHQGQFGVSTHGPTSTSARVYGTEVIGTIREEDYALIGDAAVHKHHRNNIEKINYTGDSSTHFINLVPKISSGGTGYSDATNVATQVGSSSGASGLTVDITTSGGVITEVVVNQRGGSYIAEETVVVNTGNANATLIIAFVGDVASFSTGSSFDNAFASHMIPRTDNQTRWITASLI